MKAIAKVGGINTFSEAGKAGLTVVVLFILARSVSQTGFGMFTLAQALSLLLMTVGSLGMGRAIPRQIGYYRAKKDEKRINSIIRSGIRLTAVSAVVLSIAYYLLAYPLAEFVFKDDALMVVFQAFSLHLAANIIIMQIGAVFRGIGDVRPKVYYLDILPRVLAVGAFAVLWWMDAPVEHFAVAYAVAFAFSALLAIGFLLSHRPRTTSGVPMNLALLAFSLPLLGQEILQVSNALVSVLLLGSMSDTGTVASFTTAQWIAFKLPILYLGMMFIYMPVLSGYFAKGKIERLRRAYSRITKWITTLTLPALMIVFLFPSQVLNLLYGGYSDSWLILVVLAVGHTIRIFIGPAGQTMLAMGKVRVLMYMAGIGAITNITLNLALIPVHGATGSAVATATSLGLYCIMMFGYNFRTARIHAFDRGYLKLITLGPLACIGEYLLLTTLLGIGAIAMLIAVPLFLVTVPAIALALGVITREEKDFALRKFRSTISRKR